MQAAESQKTVRMNMSLPSSESKSEHQARRQHEACSMHSLFDVGFLLGLFLDPEDGSYVFIRIVF
jgi:hypothetical protein